MNSDICLIVFYFGPFPEYFPLFLHSCAYNPHVDWWIYTDQTKKNLSLPENVKLIHMNFAECRALFASKFKFPISLEIPKKLCDFKPLYGYVLESELKKYRYWGHCDLDVIWGQLHLSEFLQSKDGQLRDKVFTLGHLTCYRNDPKVNKAAFFYRGGKRLREVLSTPQLVAFDEWGAENINDIFLRSGQQFYAKPFGSDIWPMRTIFQKSFYNSEIDRYAPVHESEGILFWQKGVLTYIYSDGRREETPYVHLQKRRLPVAEVLKDVSEKEGFYITPKGFFPGSIGETAALKTGVKHPIMDTQYFKVKTQNMLTRICGRR